MILSLISSIFVPFKVLSAQELDQVFDREPISEIYSLEETKDFTELIPSFNAHLQELANSMAEVIEEENQLYSPLSIYMALAAYRAALDGEAREKFDEVFMPHPFDEELDQYFINNFDAEQNGQDLSQPLYYSEQDFARLLRFFSYIGDINPYLADSPGEDEYDPDQIKWTLDTFAIKNEDQDLKFSDYFLDNMAVMGMPTNELDFKDSASFDLLNEVIAERTHDLISPFYSDEYIKELIQKDLKLIITNILYFKDAWHSTFEEWATQDESFYGSKEKTTVPMMEQTLNTKYLETDEYQAIELFYEGGASMFVVLPKEDVSLEDRYEFLTEALESEEWDYREVSLKLPRWEQEARMSLVPLVEKLGLDFLLDTLAEGELKFFADDTSRDSVLTEILQATKIKVDEEGTEAAAVTTIMVDTTSIRPPEEIIYMTVNKPFVYQIQDQGLILFQGSVADIEEQ